MGLARFRVTFDLLAACLELPQNARIEQVREVAAGDGLENVLEVTIASPALRQDELAIRPPLVEPMLERIPSRLAWSIRFIDEHDGFDLVGDPRPIGDGRPR